VVLRRHAYLGTTAELRINDRIKAHDAMQGAANGDHETITLAWLAWSGNSSRSTTRGHPVRDFATCLSELCGETNHLLNYCSAPIPTSERARRAWAPQVPPVRNGFRRV
jgi:hypothetical protein